MGQSDPRPDRPVSARDSLIELFDAGGPHRLFSSEETADLVLNEHAHELAEKQRDLIGRTDYPNESRSDRRRRAYGRALADSIDPEVSE